MKIERRVPIKYTPRFGNIECGECFIYKDVLYMRMHGMATNAVALKDGTTNLFLVDTEVEPIKTKVVVG